MASVWADYLPPDESVALADRPEPGRNPPPEIGVYFGCQLGWDTSREGGRVDLVMPHPVTSEPVVVEVCPVCHSGMLRDPLASRVVCMGCMRSSLDPVIDDILGSEPLPAPEPAEAPADKPSITVPDRYRNRITPKVPK